MRGVGARARRQRFLVLTQYYHPEPNFITADVAEALARDADVTVVTTHPNYPNGDFYPGTRYRRIERSRVNGVTIWRVPMIPDHSLSPVRRALSYLSFTVMAGVVAIFVAGRPDTVWVYQTPFTTGVAALWFKFVLRTRTVYTCADLWPESFAATGVVRSAWVMRLMATYNRAINRAADLIICSTPGTAERYRQDGIPEDRLVVIPVWVGGVDELAARACGPAHSPRTIVYAGNLGPAQKLDTVIEAAAKLHAAGAAVDFDLYGSGSAEAELKALAERLGAVNVTFKGRVALDVAFDASSSALAQIILLQRSALFRMTVPSKLFMAFAAAAPLLYGLEGDAAMLAASSRGGIEFDSSDSDTLVHAVMRLLELSTADRGIMRRNLRSYFSTHFDPSILVARYRALLGVSPVAEGPT